MKKENILLFEKGNCDCCLEDNINVMVCTSNNKCTYAMCANCMTELRLITKTNKCPNCRETKKEIDISSDEERALPPLPPPPDDASDSEQDSETDEVDLDRLNKCERLGKGLKCIFKWIYYLIGIIICQIPFYITVGYYECIFDCYDIQSLRNNNTKKKIVVLSTMILLIIIAIFLGSVTHMVVIGINPFNIIQYNPWTFLFQSLLGLVVLLAIIAAVVIVGMCLCSCFFEEREY